MKSTITQRLSLRCKFKSADTIEVAVVNHETGDCFIHLLHFEEGFTKSDSVKSLKDEEIKNSENQEIVCLKNDVLESDSLSESGEQDLNTVEDTEEAK